MESFRYVSFEVSHRDLESFVGPENYTWSKTAWMDKPDEWSYMSFVKTQFGWEPVHDGDAVLIRNGFAKLEPVSNNAGVVTASQINREIGKMIQQSRRFQG